MEDVSAMKEKFPPIREHENHIEIDAKKGKWPFLHVDRDPEGGITIVMDCNEGGQVVGEAVGVSVIRLSPKKARRLREFLERTEEA